MHLATSEYIAKNPVGQSVPVVFNLYAPELDPLSEQGDYRCKIEIPAISFEKYAYGVDSLQALCLAVETLRLTMSSLQSDGWRFYFPQHQDHHFDLLSAYFPRSDVQL
ncbi:DUF6968 family protein [Rheinheimera sp. MM224]|uniref:DUF6968 family protein n=1 Tax=Rheinheimera sp. MM224 TaxID=3019969 RepID=UPI0021F90DE2|nr:hypothetical protein [Rheinheimera sp. MM224]CAI3800309.1 hypothetical protein JAMGFMIE_02552 [Rheinheimera sp. MM224]